MGTFMTHAITLKNVTKTFGDTTAVRDVSLLVPEGALYGLIGPNGAGKTTLIRMILSILFPDKGELRVLGHESAMEAKGPSWEISLEDDAKPSTLIPALVRTVMPA
jgi:ABC-2 type transport system ATP-binding protein